LSKIIFSIRNSNSLKGHRGTTLIHRNYTRKPLKYRKRTKLQELKEISTKKVAMYKGIGTASSLTLTSPSDDLQTSLRSFLSKYTTLNIKKPTSPIPKHCVVPIVPSNSPTNLSPFEA
jgi:hypothetical protein